MTRRPTRRAAVIAGVGLLLVIAGSTAQSGWLFVLAAGVLSLIGASSFTRHRLRAINVEREAPAAARVGDEVPVRLIVRNRGRGTVPAFRLEDPHGGLAARAVLVERLEAGTGAAFEDVRVAERRGRFRDRDVTLTTGWPFGLVRSRRSFGVPGEIVIVPRWVELPSFPILEPSSSPSELLHERARTRAGEDYFGVREYRPGDPQRFVHWRSTARTGRLVVREFEEEVASPVALVLAGADAGEPPDSAFEVLVQAAASIGLYALQTGHPLECVRAAPDGSPEHLSGAGRRALLSWLADAQPADVGLTPLAAEAVRHLRRRGTAVLIAPDAGVAGADLPGAVGAVQGAGCRVIVVAADVSSWATDLPISLPAAGLGGGRALLRVVEREKDLRTCLLG